MLIPQVEGLRSSNRPQVNSRMATEVHGMLRISAIVATYQLTSVVRTVLKVTCTLLSFTTDNQNIYYINMHCIIYIYAQVHTKSFISIRWRTQKVYVYKINSQNMMIRFTLIFSWDKSQVLILSIKSKL